MDQKLALVFPGQGSQKVGMCTRLVEIFPVVKTLFDQASEVLQYDLLEIINSGPEEKLNQTIYTQPAMLVTDLCYWHIWSEGHDELPAFLAGHSLGEYAALVVAEAIDFVDAVRLVSNRATLMQDAVPAGEGAMAVVLGLTLEQIQTICEQTSVDMESVEAVNLNAPGQIVIAGTKKGIDQAIELAKSMQAKRAMKLPISIPSHSRLMKPAAETFSEILQAINIHTPKIPVIHNVDILAKDNPDDIRSALVAQLYSPVRWIETIQFFKSQHIETVLEIGPGKVLTGLNKRIDATIENIAFYDELT